MTATPHGLMPVLETPFDEGGAIDVEGFRTVAAHAIRSGADGLMFPGFASEFHKLTEGERIELTAAMLDLTRGTDVLGIVSVPDYATRIAVRNVELAIAAGADAVNVLPPFVIPPTHDGVIVHLDAVLDAAASVPVVVQFAPAQTGSALAVDDLLRLADRHPNLAAIKVEIVPPGPFITELVAAGIPGIVGYAGLDLIDAYGRGAIGVQPGSSFPELYRRVLDLWSSDADASTALHARMVPYLASWMTGVDRIVRVEKRISRLRGLIASEHCRAPAASLSDADLAEIDAFLAEFAEELA